jgi:tetratricopeptide (TPR) repeat protein
MGVLSPYNLSRALVEQVEAKLFEVFAWPDGQYMFKQGEPPPRESLKLERPPATLILEGIRRHYDAGRQQAVLDAYAGKYVALSRDPMLRLQEVTADPMEQAFVREIDGRTRLETVIDSARIPRDKARLLLVALSQAGMIEPSDAPVRRNDTPATRTDEATEGTPGPAAVPGMPLNASQLALVAQTVRTQNHFWALGVRPDDSTAAIDQAYEGLARSFHPDRYRQRPEEDRKLAQEIFDRLAEAHRVLREPTRRRAYAAKLDKQRPSDTPSGPIPGGAAKELYDAGTQHLRANRHREAVEAFRQAARMVPDQADFRAALGWALFREAPADARAGRAALAELRRAIQLDPKNRRARYYLGNFYSQTGQPDLAITEFERLLELDPGAIEVADELRRLRESR